jgi:peptidoglycan/LPS O-acetylase OafA/YrhL
MQREGAGMFWTVFTVAASIIAAVMAAYLCVRLLESDRVKRGWRKKRVHVPKGPRYPKSRRHWIGHLFVWNIDWVPEDKPHDKD